MLCVFLGQSYIQLYHSENMYSTKYFSTIGASKNARVIKGSRGIYVFKFFLFFITIPMAYIALRYIVKRRKVMNNCVGNINEKAKNIKISPKPNDPFILFRTKRNTLIPTPIPIVINCKVE